MSAETVADETAKLAEANGLAEARNRAMAWRRSYREAGQQEVADALTPLINELWRAAEAVHQVAKERELARLEQERNEAIAAKHRNENGNPMASSDGILRRQYRRIRDLDQRIAQLRAELPADTAA